MEYEKTVVNTTTQEEYDLVVKICEEKLGKSFFASIYTRYGNDTCIDFSGISDDLGFSSYGWFKKEGYTIISVEEFLKLFDEQKDIVDVSSNVNPKESLGLSNIPMNMFSPIACAYGSIGKLNGSLKYGKSNYLGTDVIMSIYMDAIKRHTDAIMAGEDVDKDDGVPHFAAILANVDIILCAKAAGTLIDDRPLLVGYREEMEKLKPLVKHLQELHKDKHPKHFYLKGI